MKIKTGTTICLLAFAAIILVCAGYSAQATAARALPPASDLSSAATFIINAPLADNPNPPTATIKLIFIHHSTGGNWLASSATNDPGGDLGAALRDNNYFVSATNYGWGPDAIGDRTDIPNWPEWFTGPDHATILAALYTESNQNICNPSSPLDDCFGDWPRLPTDPGGENKIIMFKSCFPNSDLYGNPTDDPLPAPNDYEYTVANAKAVYNDILTYFAARQDKLFIVITAPPLQEGDTTPDRAANARAFNNWLVNDWLASNNYTHTNVAVFDYYNVLTSNGSPTRIDDTSVITEPNDYDSRPNGNHHYWDGSAITHTQTISNNYSAYPNGDSHPTTTGHQKATQEFVQWLNIHYHRWKSAVTASHYIFLPLVLRNHGAPTCVALNGVTISGATNGYTNTLYIFTANPTPSNASSPLYTWSPQPASGQGSSSASYQWNTIGSKTISVTASNCGGLANAAHDIIIQSLPGGALAQPADFTYLGAFRLPGGDTPPQTFAYGGNAMTFNPDGHITNTDPYSGSLFVMGHDRQAWGGLPDGNQVAEITIPTPVISENIETLPYAEFIQNFANVTAGFFTDMEEIPKVGMQYLNHPDTGPKIHMCWGQHLQPENTPSHAWFNPALASPDLQGVWFIGNQNLYSVNGYMFDIPAAWADAHAEGRYLATGRMRDGGQGGMGPTLFAYRPWLSGGAAPISGTHLAETTLLLYENAYTTEEITRCLTGYQHPDEWEGGAWLTTPSGKSAVLFAGTKSNGAKYWYGYVNPLGPQYPCVDQAVIDFTTCRMADGSSCPPEDFTECAGHTSERGWWSTRFDAELILYDPADLGQVAAGTMDSWQPQPYAAIDIDDHLYLVPPEWDLDNLGTGVQRRYRIGDATYDRENGFLYVLELYADGAKPVVHVWRIQ